MLIYLKFTLQHNTITIYWSNSKGELSNAYRSLKYVINILYFHLI